MSYGSRTAGLFAMLGLLTAAGCGYKGSSQMYQPPTTMGTAATAHASINIGDAPSDRVIAFELTINSVVLTANDNSTVSVLAQPRRIEITHLSATTEPLALLNIPQGTYKSAAISVSAPDVLFVDNSGSEVEHNDSSFTTTVTINFSPLLTVGSAPLVLTLDANVGSSVTINPTTGAVTFNPTFTITTGTLPAAGHEGDEDDDDGELEHIIGTVTSVSGTSFTIQTAGSMSLTFGSGASTRVEGASSIATLPVGALVRVEGATQQDGSLLATEVEVMGSMEAEAEGFVTSTTGNPVSSFTLVLQDGDGAGFAGMNLGAKLTVNVSSSTAFQIDGGQIDLSGLALPNFSAATLSQAQRVEIDNDTPFAGTLLTARTVKLEQEALTGAISGLSGSQFTLTVASDSAFALLTGKTAISVISAKNVQLNTSSALANGATVRVRGLLFFDSTSGSYQLVAGRITNP